MIVAPDEISLFMEIMVETGVIQFDPVSGETIVVNEEILEKIKAYCSVVQDDLTISGVFWKRPCRSFVYFSLNVWGNSLAKAPGPGDFLFGCFNLQTQFP